MIRISDLVFCYPHSGFLLRVPELRIAVGEHVALVGPSGSGKSTLLALIAGILRPVQGTIRLGDDELTSLPDSALRRVRVTRIGLVFQAFELVDYLSVLENVLLPCLISGALPLNRDMHARAGRLLDSVGLGGRARRRVTELSHGEKQRVALARALLNQPAYLLADEPTGNLDAANKFLVVDLLTGQASRRGATLLMVTHDGELLDRFERVIDLREFSDEDASTGVALHQQA